MANVPRVSDMTNSRSRLDDDLDREWKDSRKIFAHNRNVFGKRKIGKSIWKNTKNKTRSL